MISCLFGVSSIWKFLGGQGLLPVPPSQVALTTTRHPLAWVELLIRAMVAVVVLGGKAVDLAGQDGPLGPLPP